MLSKRVQRMVNESTAYPYANTTCGANGETIRMCSNESPFGPPPKVVEAIRQASERIGNYPDPKASRLKEVIAKYLKIKPEQVVVSNGSDEIMDLACKAFMDPGDKALIPLPTFAQYELSCLVNSCEPNFIELKDFNWDESGLPEALNDSKMAFISRPNNPTGNGISDEGLKKLLETGKIVILDEAYVEFASYSAIEFLKDFKNLIILRTFSKAFGLAGLRIGYGIGDEDLISALELIRAPFSVNVLAQVAATAALCDGAFLQRVQNLIKTERKNLITGLEGLGMRVLPSDANFVMVNATTIGMSAPELRDKLAKRGILIRDLSGFKGAGPDWVRITVGTPRQNKRLLEALKNVKEVN